jgi:AAA domain
VAILAKPYRKSYPKPVDEDYEEDPNPQVDVLPIEAIGLSDLLDMKFEPPVWIIQDIIIEGLNLLFSPPKVGKTMTSMFMAIDYVRRNPDKEALYLTLDDKDLRRFQDRALDLIQGREIDNRLWIANGANSLSMGLVKQLELWIKDHPDTGFIVIDAYVAIKPASKKDVFKGDYNALMPLKEFGLKHHIGVLLTHHTRKQKDSSDWTNDINGSTGLLAAPDVLLSIKRDFTSDMITLLVKGREPFEGGFLLSLNDLDEEWKEIGQEENPEMDTAEDKIMQLFLDQQCIMSPKRIAELTGLPVATVKTSLRRSNLFIRTSRGAYGIPEFIDESFKVSSDIGIGETLKLSDPGQAQQNGHNYLEVLRGQGFYPLLTKDGVLWCDAPGKGQSDINSLVQGHESELIELLRNESEV